MKKMPGKRVQVDEETWEAIEAVMRDSDSTFQELTDEAFADADVQQRHERWVTHGRCSAKLCDKTVGRQCRSNARGEDAKHTLGAARVAREVMRREGGPFDDAENTIYPAQSHLHALSEPLLDHACSAS